MNSPKNLTREDILALIAREDYHLQGRTTICVITTRSGFEVVGETSCADPAKFDEEAGRRYALAVAIERLWPFEVYAQGRIAQERPWQSNEGQFYDDDGGRHHTEKTATQLVGHLSKKLADAFKDEEEAERAHSIVESQAEQQENLNRKRAAEVSPLQVGDIVRRFATDPEKLGDLTVLRIIGDGFTKVEDVKGQTFRLLTTTLVLVRRPQAEPCEPEELQPGDIVKVKDLNDLEYRVIESGVLVWVCEAAASTQYGQRGFSRHMLRFIRRPAPVTSDPEGPRSVHSVMGAFIEANKRPDVEVPTPAELNGEAIPDALDALSRYTVRVTTLDGGLAGVSFMPTQSRERVLAELRARVAEMQAEIHRLS